MLYGAYCTQDIPAPIVLGSFPGSLGYLDFLNGSYQVAKTTATAADVISQPGKVDASGLSIDWDLDNSKVYIIGSFLTILQTVDWTLVIEYSQTASYSQNPLGLCPSDGSMFDPPGDYFFITDASSTDVIIDDQKNGVGSREADFFTGGPDITSPRRVAITRKPSALSISVNGGTVAADSSSLVALAPEAAVFGAVQKYPDEFANFQGHIRKLIIYPAISDAALVAISSGEVQYPGAAAVANFVDGIYRVAGADVTAADMIDHPEFIDANGLMIQWDTNPGSTYPLSGFLISLLVAEVTIVIEITETDTGTMFPLFMGNNPPDTSPRWIDSGDSYVAFFDYNGNRGPVESVVPARPGIRRIAITTTTSHASLSVNGRPTITDSTAGTGPSLTQAVIGGNTFDGWAFMVGHIRAIEVWPVQGDDILPFMSAL